MNMATQSQGQNSQSQDDLDALESSQVPSTGKGDPSAPSIKHGGQEDLDGDVSFDEEGYEISRPRQERPMAQQDPPVGRPLTSDR
jgi:hypothetical protein